MPRKLYGLHLTDYKITDMGILCKLCACYNSITLVCIRKAQRGYQWHIYIMYELEWNTFVCGYVWLHIKIAEISTS